MQHLAQSLADQARIMGMPGDAFLLLVEGNTQEMFVYRMGSVLAIWPVSTSAMGFGCTADSGQTPTGFHEITERIGAGLPNGSVLKSRQPTGQVLPPSDWASDAPDDLVLTRILWLSGKEPGINCGPGCDSHARYIYIHGTNHEQHIGTPASHGCVRMNNLDVVDLFKLLGVHPAWVWIGSAV